MQKEELFYQICSLGGGPYISRLITIKEKFSWSVHYQ